MIKQAVVILIALVTGLFACDSNRVFEENVEMTDGIWVADSSVIFKFEIKEPKRKYNLYYNLRNTISYPFQNIYVNYTLGDTLGNVIAEELINKDLFHPKTGKPYGSGLGDIFDHQFLIMKDYQFDEPGIYSLKLEQYMRRDSLPDVLSVGARVEWASENQD